MWFKSKEEATPEPLVVEAVEQYKVGGTVFPSKSAAEDYAKNNERRVKLADEVVRALRLTDGHGIYDTRTMIEIIIYLETYTTIKENK